MFVCDCPTCGRRELRGPRSLLPRGRSWWAVCRRCGADVLVLPDPRERAAAEVAA